MTIARELQALCPNTVTIAPFLSADSYSKPTYGSGTVYSCLIDRKTQLFRTAEGQQVVSTCQIYLTSAPGVSAKDKITLPDSSTPIILGVRPVNNTLGSYFEVIYT